MCGVFHQDSINVRRAAGRRLCRMGLHKCPVCGIILRVYLRKCRIRKNMPKGDNGMKHYTFEHFHFHVGQRNIKTALAATLCALAYFIVGRNPTFACIGAIFGVGSDMGNSRLNGGNRFFGTLFGGVLGMALFRLYICFYPQGGYHFLLLLLLFLGVIVLIIVSVLCHGPGAVQPGGVVLCILLFNTPVETYISYSLNRIIDTGIGVLFALLVNYLLPRERVVRWLVNAHMCSVEKR